ncbi:putative uncharacterized protein [Prevotella sp. CAG:617]|jgi:chromosome segregation ATPase|nr:putative uncharacterized protein [Prevotella sp. CAG:617]
MTNEELESLKRFQTRVRQLILQYRELQNAIDGYVQRIEVLEAENERLKKQGEQARQEYANLKLAKMIEVGDSDVRDAKTRITKLIHEVDKCIALLNV